MMNPAQLNALAGGADSGGYVSVGGIPLAPLLVWAPQRRFGHEKGHGVLDVASGQDTKGHHETTIGSQDAAEPDSLRSVRERLSDTTGGSRCPSTSSCARAVRRALRWC